tara:strand:+ start:4595 stop:5344 length:750 start_codon:yes stop_codon:yes gene_type:complete
MKYMGSKSSISKHILPIILKNRKEGQHYVEPFGGGANSICDVPNPRIYNDFNAKLATFFREALYNNFIPPKEISRELYNWARDENKKADIEQEALVGYIGINGSYSGRWFDGGYAGITTTSNGKVRNYPEEAYNNVMKQLPKLQGCEFHGGDYRDLLIPPNSIIYCDPPYAGTKEYIAAKKSGFDSCVFWDWCRQMSNAGHTVFVSEYNAPEDFTCVWEKSVTSSLRANSVIKGAKTSIEKLFTYNKKL